jgi:hypothetical protein
MWLGSLVLLLATAHPAARGLAVNSPDKSAQTACPALEMDFGGGNDMQALKAYGAAVRQLFKQEKFKELDCLADTARGNKERIPGGMWKIHEFYWAVTELPGHLTEQDWKEQLRLVQKWAADRPLSITARVVLAKTYINYAWDARGKDTSDSVTESGWKLFGDRLEKAKATLDEASTLSSKCPEWYLVMQDVALGLGWGRPEAMDLLKRAIAFEPAYYYYYRSSAYYLMPQWNGEDGDAARFAAESADHVGSDAGDILYFQIGEKIVCACNDPEFAHLSWARLQKGYTTLEKEYGVSLANLNRLALMASKSGDSVVADSAFQRIGDNWDKEAWITQTYFDQNKTWAAQVAPAEARSRAILQEAATNLQSEGGAQYQKTIEQAMLPFMRQCVQSSNNDQTKFELIVKVGKDGSPEDAWFREPTAMAQCMMREIYESHVKKETPFPVPPRPDYWLDLHLDPSSFSVAAAN